MPGKKKLPFAASWLCPMSCSVSCAPLVFQPLCLLTKQMFDRHRDNSFKICSSCGQHSDKRPCISTATQPRPYATWLNCPWRHCLASSSKWQTPLYGRRKNRSFVRRQFVFPLGSNFETLYFFPSELFLGGFHNVESSCIQTWAAPTPASLQCFGVEAAQLCRSPDLSWGPWCWVAIFITLDLLLSAWHCLLCTGHNLQLMCGA